MEMASALRYTCVWITWRWSPLMCPEKMNTLKAEFASQVRAILKQIRDNKDLRGVVFISAKPDNFIAGADINMIGNCRSAQEAETPLVRGNR